MINALAVLFNILVIFLIFIYPKALLCQIIEHESAVASGEEAFTQRAFLLGAIPFISDVYLCSELDLKVLRVAHIVYSVLFVPVVINIIILSVIQPTTGLWLIATRIINIVMTFLLYTLQVLTAGRVFTMFNGMALVMLSLFPPIAYLLSYINAPKFYKEAADVLSDRFRRGRD